MISGYNLRYPIGIDIGKDELYAAQLQRTSKGIVVSGLSHMELDGTLDDDTDTCENLIASLKTLSQSKQFRGKSVVVHIPSRHTSIFPIHFQVGKTELIEESILRESEKHLRFPLEEAILDYTSISPVSTEDSNTFNVMVVAVHRDIIKKYLSWIGQADLIAEAIDFGVFSLIRLHRHFYDLSPNPIILCHIGNNESLLTVTTGDQILVGRPIAWGIKTLYERIMANLDLMNQRDTVLYLLKQHGMTYSMDRISDDPADDKNNDPESANINGVIYQIISPYIDELINELLKMISYLRMRGTVSAIESIYLYGPVILIRHLDRYFKNRLNIPVTCVNPLARMALSQGIIVNDLPEGLPFALTLGLSMRKVPWL
jgi:type IV pilus assembly protein PilM